MEGFIAVVSIIFGLLSLILFFKIWGACDDIKEIRNSICGNTVRIDNSTHKEDEYHIENIKRSTVEEIWSDDIKKLNRRMAKCQSDRERLDWLDKFLDGKASQLKKYTIKGGELVAMNNWALLIEWISPLYKTSGGEVPEEYKNFTL